MEAGKHARAGNRVEQGTRMERNYTKETGKLRNGKKNTTEMEWHQKQHSEKHGRAGNRVEQEKERERNDTKHRK